MHITFILHKYDNTVIIYMYGPKFQSLSLQVQVYLHVYSISQASFMYQILTVQYRQTLTMYVHLYVWFGGM